MSPISHWLNNSCRVIKFTELTGFLVLGFSQNLRKASAREAESCFQQVKDLPTEALSEHRVD
jgi:hypothetical protein